MDIRQIRRAIGELDVERPTDMKIAIILEAIVDRLDAIEARANRAANTASCLANGIQPD